MLKVDWLNSYKEIPEQLWDACFKAPYEGRWWYAALEDAQLNNQFTFLYGLVYLNDKPIAIAPAFVMNVPINLVVPPALLPIFNILGKVSPSFLYQRTFFIGSPCSDEGRVGLMGDTNTQEILTAINVAMQLKASILKAPMRVWKDFSNEHKIALTQVAKQQGLFSLVSFPGADLALVGKDKQGYLSSLKSSRRSKLNKKLKQAALAPLDAEIVQNPDSEKMGEVFALFWQTYEKGNTKFEQLNRPFFELISADKRVHYVILRNRDTQKIAAFMLCFHLGDHVINKFIGIDYTLPKEWFVYFRLWEVAVEWSYNVGATSIQSGQTGYAPKIELGNEMVPLTNYCKHQNWLIHQIFKIVANTINWDTLDEDLAIYMKAYPEHNPKP